MGAVDWKGAFDRLDPTVNVSKLIKMGVRPSLISVIIEYLEDRQMSVCYNTAWSKWHKLVGGAPQGSWLGQTSYISASDDAASWLEDEDRFKYCDDLSILELIMLGDILTEYDYKSHVPSDVGIGQKFIQPQLLKTQQNMQQIATWSNLNLMRLNESKTKYIIFTRTKTEFSTRITVNENVLERVKTIKLLGVWLQEDGGWQTNTREMCKRAYAKVGLITKLKYAGVSTGDLLLLYKLHVRSCLEYCVVAWHSSISSRQEAAIERCQAICLKIILQDSYVTYKAALEMTGLESLTERRESRCRKFSQSCLKHETNRRFFPENENTSQDIRKREKFKVNFAFTNIYKKSAIPYCQRLLNHLESGQEEEEEESQGGGRR